MSTRQRTQRYSIILAVILFSLCSRFAVVRAQTQVVYEDFTTQITGNDSVLLEWWTETEGNNRAFYVQRSTTSNGVYARLEDSYLLSESENGEGGYYYFYEDTTALYGQVYYYRLEAIDDQDNSSFFGPINIQVIQVNTGTPTVTGTIIIPTNLTPTPTRGQTTTPTLPDSTATVAAAFTQSFLELTGTVRTTSILTGTQELGITTTPTPSKTFEPLPTIELLFPTTTTTETQVQERSAVQQAAQPTPTEIKARGLALAELPDRLVVSMGVVGLLWLCLGMFLVFIIKRMSD